MQKLFEVFPDETGKQAEKACLSRPQNGHATKQKDFVWIYLTSDRLIQKERYFTVASIKKQLSPMQHY